MRGRPYTKTRPRTQETPLAGYIEDLWLTKKPDPATGKRRRKSTYGVGMRWRVKNIPGVRDRSFELLEDAKTWLEDANASTRKQEFVDPRDGKILLADYIEQHWWPSTVYGISTAGTARGRIFNHIVPHLGHLPLVNIGQPELRAWLATLQDELAASTIAGVWGCLSGILEAAGGDGRLARNPCRTGQVGPPAITDKPARAWPRPTVDAIRSKLPDRYKILVDLGVGLGLRQGEAFGFSLDDITGGIAHIRRQVVAVGTKRHFALPKGGKERWIPVPPALEKRARLHAEQIAAPASVTLPWIDPDRPKQARDDMRRVTASLLVPTPTGLAERRTTWNDRRWKPALVGAGLLAPGVRQGKSEWLTYEPSRELGFHSLRHTFASVQLEAGESIVTLARWLGHKSVKTTLEHYAHFLPEAGARGIAAMDRWFD